MTDNSIVSNVGKDPVARDAANDLQGSWCKANAQKMFAIMSKWHAIYRGPRRLVFNLTSSARRAFSNPKPAIAKGPTRGNTPFED